MPDRRLSESAKSHYRALAMRVLEPEEREAIAKRWTYDPDQPRDPEGKFASEGGEDEPQGGGGGRAPARPRAPAAPRAPRAPAPVAKLPDWLDDHEQRAVRAWLGPEHDAINAEARSGRSGPWAKTIADLDHAIAAAPTIESDLKVFRNRNGDLGLTPGRVVRDEGFTSTSSRPLGQTGIEITVPRGGHALNIPGTQEVLLPRGTHFRVDAVADNAPIGMTVVEGPIKEAAQAAAKKAALEPPPGPPRFTKGIGGTSQVLLDQEALDAIQKHLARFGVTEELVQHNIDVAFAALTPQQKQDGQNWYRNAHDIASRLATQFGRKRRNVAAAISALSPRTDWERNVNNARALVAFLELKPDATLEETHAVIRTAMEPHLKLAMSLLDPNTNIEKTLTGPKRRAFFVNIVNPTQRGPVTIDSHMVDIMTGLGKAEAQEVLADPRVRDVGKGAAKLRGQGTYAWFADQLRAAAERHNEIPNQFQAKLWMLVSRPPGFYKAVGSSVGSQAAAELLGEAKVSGAAAAINPITAAEARGNSREVTLEEFQSLAAEGKRELDAMKARSSETTGLNRDWTAIKRSVFQEVQKSWGGATIDSHTGKALATDADKFALTVKEGKQHTFSVVEGATFAQFANAMDVAKREFRDQLRQQKHYLGVFHDDDNHRIDIDPVVVVDNVHDVETIGAYTHAIGGAYHFKSGDGFFPPHVGGARQQPDGTGVHFESVAQWHSYAVKAQQIPVHLIDDTRSLAADGEAWLVRYRSLWLRSRSEAERAELLKAVEKRRDETDT